MFAKRLFKKAISNHLRSHAPPPHAPPRQAATPHAPTQSEEPRERLSAVDLNPHNVVHYGIPSTASILAFDPIQSLLAVGTLDGRIKVLGDDNVEGIFTSPKQVPFKNLEFIQNQGFLVSVSNENDIQVWDLEHRQTASCLQWESNITSFSVLHGTTFMYVGDEYGMVNILKYDSEGRKLVQLPYYVPADALAEAAQLSSLIQHQVVGLLPQPCSQGNRLLIAFANGLIFLWDASEDCVVIVRGNKDLALKNNILADSQECSRGERSENVSVQELEEKEISSLCWASTDGSVLAVGYIDGDILFWNFSTAASTIDHQAGESCNDVVQLQLSSGGRRLPVILMQWSANRSNNDSAGELFAYGGDEIGSEEALTILSLDWSSGLGSLKCIARVDLTLNGAFADMILSPIAGTMKSCGVFLFVLSNPGQLHIYDDGFLDAVMSQQDKNSLSPMQYSMVIPTMEPYMTVAKLASVYIDGKASRILSETVQAAKVKLQNAQMAESTKWPLIGGFTVQHFGAEGHQVERLYVAGYQDGSARIWDATYPALSLIYVLGPEVTGIKIPDGSASVSALDLCSLTLSLAIGNECGMVRLYNLTGNPVETSVHVLTDTDKKVHILHQGDGPQCTAVLSLLNSPVSALQFTDSGDRLAVGFNCGRVAMLDINSYSVLYLTDSLSSSSCPISSLSMKSCSDIGSLIPNISTSGNLNIPQSLTVFLMTRDAHFVVLDGNTGDLLASSYKLSKESTVISMYILDGGNLTSEVHGESSSFKSSQNSESEDKSGKYNAHSGNVPEEHKPEVYTKAKILGQRIDNLLIFLCCEDSLRLYSVETLAQGGNDCIREVNFGKLCCWTATFKKDEKECGLVLLYQTGVIEIRSLPNLEVLVEISLMSILRWSFKNNMEKTICASDRGYLMLTNGCEFAILSLLAQGNDFRIPESLPCLHDEALASTVSTISLSPHQDTIPGVVSNTVKDFRVGSMEQNAEDSETYCENISRLEAIFSNPPFLKPSISMKDDQNILELDIDDINIDEPIVVLPSSPKIKHETKDKGTEGAKLFEGGTSDAEAKPRTAEEIRAKYRKSGDASTAASQARDKLVQRKEKLEKLSRRTEELQSGAENFSNMANDLVKQMEKRKWWNF